MMQEKKNDGCQTHENPVETLRFSASPVHLQKHFLRFFKQIDGYCFLLAFAMMGMFWCLHLLLGGGFAAPTFYNTYTRQAMAWRQGLLHLPQDFPWLELAVYPQVFEGGTLLTQHANYYVSFPPLPSVVLLPFTFIFGEQTPDNLLVKLYGLIGCFAIYASLKKAGNSRPAAALLSFLITTASSALPMMLNGAVWYHAQMLAFMLMCLSVMLMLKGMPTGSLFLYALSVACRPFDALYGPLLYFFYLRTHRDQPFKKTALQLLPGTVLGLCVAGGLAWYNAARFGDVLEFGHNYLPEFSFQGGIQFSASHVKNHIPTFVLGSPLSVSHDGSYSFNAFGYSLFLACPAITLMLLQAIRDLIQKRFTLVKLAILLFMAVQLFLLMMHRTFGGYQLGARYVVDLVPYAVMYFGISREEKGRNALFITLLFLVLVFTGVGISFIHI